MEGKVGREKEGRTEARHLDDTELYVLAGNLEFKRVGEGRAGPK